MVQAQLRVHLLESPVLFLELLQPLQIGCRHPAVLALPGVVGRIRDADFSADLFDLAAAFDLFQHLDDLCLGES